MVTLYDRILLPTDGSAGMRRVIEHAADLAAAHDATIHALYVLDSASFTSLPMETSWESISQLLEDEGNQALDALERRVGDRAAVERSILEGKPSRDIVTYAREHGIDLVVMGTHGRGGIDRLLLGSVAERVVRAADVPVMTVRVHPDVGAPAGDLEFASREADQDETDHDAPADYTPEPEPGAR